MKLCPVCKIEKPLDDFNKNKTKKDKLDYRCKQCKRKWRLEKLKDQEYAISNRLRHQQRTKRIRNDVINEYGGKCVNCGINDYRILCIDHVNNDGYMERKNNPNTLKIYLFLERIGCPKDRYQLLCHHCNFLKRLNKGILETPVFKLYTLQDYINRGQ